MLCLMMIWDLYETIIEATHEKKKMVVLINRTKKIRKPSGASLRYCRLETLRRAIMYQISRILSCLAVIVAFVVIFIYLFIFIFLCDRVG